MSRLIAEELIRAVPDFPQPGILFRDITPLLADPRGFHIVLDAITERFMGAHIDAVVGIESRGFIFGGALAARLNASFVPVRKPGKLPYRTDKVSYSLEYGESELEMHRDSLRETVTETTRSRPSVAEVSIITATFPSRSTTSPDFGF